MANLIYSMLMSLDGYVADENGNFDWGEPDEEVHTFINDLQRPVGTELYGRRMYQVMLPWESPEMLTSPPAFIQDFARIWQSADKIVFSKTLDQVSSARTRLEREFSPGLIRQLKAAADRDLTVSGPNLAAQAFQAGLVDECQLFLVPVIIGGGNRALPDGVRSKLVLLDERRFASGIIYLRYRLNHG
jgi:dihydrofolate reductase